MGLGKYLYEICSLLKNVNNSLIGIHGTLQDIDAKINNLNAKVDNIEDLINSNVLPNAVVEKF